MITGKSIRGALPSRRSSAISVTMVTVVISWMALTHSARAQCDPEPCWPKVNNGDYLDAGRSLARYMWGFTSHKTSAGDLLYFFDDSVIGAAVGRLTPDSRWELWSQGGWSNTPDTVATPIDHAYGRYCNINVYDYPGCPNAVLGVASGRSNIGGRALDVHGYHVNFIFDPTGACFSVGSSQWYGGHSYDPLRLTTLIADWEGPYRGQGGGDFAFDPVSRRGILVGTFGMSYEINFWPQLTAALFKLDDATHKWRRWHRPSLHDGDPTKEWCEYEPHDFWTGPGDWHTGNSWPNVFNWCTRARHVYILNPDEDIENVRHRQPRITHIPGTANFLVTFRYAEPPSADASLKAAYYLDATGTACTTDDDCPTNTKCGEQVSGYCPRTWLWWNGTGWEEGGDYQYVDITDNVLNHRDTEYRPQLYWEAGKVVSLINADGTLVEVIYDDQAQAFTSETLSFPVRPGGVYPDYLPFSALAVDSDSTPWLAFTDHDDATRLKLTYKYKVLGTDQWQWAVPSIIYVSSAEVITPVGINFIGSGSSEEPIVFVAELSADKSLRLSAIAENAPFCMGGDCLALDPKPEPVLLSPAELAPGREMQADGSLLWGSLGIDSDAYIYAPTMWGFQVNVFPPTYSAPKDVRWWGGPFWTFRQPSGVAVDRVREKVYIASQPFCGEGTASLATCGKVRIWDMDRRDSDVDLCENTACYYSGEHVDREYFDTVLHPKYDPPACSESMDSFGWPGDVSVDEDRGLLYVTNALKNKIDVFDLKDLQDDPAPFARQDLFEGMISCETPCNRNTVESLVSEMITAAYLVDTGGDMLTWSGEDLEADIIPFVKSHALYQELYTPEDANDEERFIQNMRRHYKERHDHPCYWYSFGAFGDGAGEFMFPMGTDADQDGNLYVVDSENHRVEKWVTNEYDMLEFAFSWGSLGHGPGEFLYPFGLAVDDAYDRVYVTDPNNGRVQVFDKDGYFLHEFGAWETTETSRSVDSAFGIVADERGSVYMGFHCPIEYLEYGARIVQLSVPDAPPDVVIDSPGHCAILTEGSNAVVVSASDDWGIERIVLAVEGSGADNIVCEKDNDWTPCEQISDGFSIPWELDLAGGPPQAGVIRVTLYDVIGQEALYAVHVVLGGQDEGPDNDGDGIGDLCDNCLGYANPTQADCDHDAIGDMCEILEGGSSDCNENGVPDECDVFDPLVGDCNENGIPDDCDPYEDCNANGVQDICDVALAHVCQFEVWFRGGIAVFGAVRAVFARWIP